MCKTLTRRQIAVSCLTAVIACGCLLTANPHADAEAVSASPRQRVCFDSDWRFAFGHASDRRKDYDPARGAFSYFAKAGFATGAAAPDFDDRAWRELDLPHDWGVEAPFHGRASGSHGFKAIGRNFPERSVGWYRKSFFLPSTDLGKRVSVEFDGVFRDSQVWVNGHYVGREESGYSSFAYNLSEILKYGGENVIVVRVDASLEEGWFYEGAGIYRHVWLVKTHPLHVERHGTFVTSELAGDAAQVTIRAVVRNEGGEAADFQVEHFVYDAKGREVAAAEPMETDLPSGESREFSARIAVDQPQLWSLESPHLYRMLTVIRDGDDIVDRYATPFGVRTIRFDPNEGFFLNGKHVLLRGANNHQDHAGVGVAVPDALQEFRIARLKQVGCNAYRCAHNPPTPELLDACDRLGMLVVDENRVMGAAAAQLGQLERLIRRDRNHPSVVLWALGNEEWSIEGAEEGERVAATMQSLVHRLDPTRKVTVASSGNWGRGYSVPIDVMGFNYYSHGSTDHYHEQFPDKPSAATEEGSTFSTRGVYVENRRRQQLTAYDENCPDWGSLAHEGWAHYADRRYVAGFFIWTGFDYRGEPTPFGWPAISSQFGILDTCGFRKDNSYYYQAQWTDEPLVHLFPHWSWRGKEGEPIRVWAHTNCDAVELFLNDKSLGRRAVERHSHAEWEVAYEPGTLVARGFTDGQAVADSRVETTGPPVAVKLSPHRSRLRADGQDVSVVRVEVVDAAGRVVPTADQVITFEVAGAGRLRGVGNGNPSSHEPDQFLDEWSMVKPKWKRMNMDAAEPSLAVGVDYDDSDWPELAVLPSNTLETSQRLTSGAAVAVYRGAFDRPRLADNAEAYLLIRGHAQDSVYLNGALCDLKESPCEERVAATSLESLRNGKNVITIVSEESHHAGGASKVKSPAVVKFKTPAQAWKRRLFSGLAQVIVQSTDESGELTLKATAPGLDMATAKLISESTE